MSTNKGLREPGKCEVWILLRKRGVSEILASLRSGESSFNELRKKLDVSSNTLSDRLRELRKGGVVEALIVQMGEKFYKKYKLTDKGVSLVSHLGQMLGVLEKSFGETEPPKPKGMPIKILKG